MKKLLITVGLVAVAFWLLKRLRLKDNDLIQHFKAQNELSKLGKLATYFGQESLSQYPLSMIGDTPMAGLNLDPFASAYTPVATIATPKFIDINPWNPNVENKSSTGDFVLSGGYSN